MRAATRRASTPGSSHSVTGYTILQAESLESLKPLLDNHPHLMTRESDILN